MKVVPFLAEERSRPECVGPPSPKCCSPISATLPRAPSYKKDWQEPHHREKKGVKHDVSVKGSNRQSANWFSLKGTKVPRFMARAADFDVGAGDALPYELRSVLRGHVAVHMVLFLTREGKGVLMNSPYWPEREGSRQGTVGISKDTNASLQSTGFHVRLLEDVGTRRRQRCRDFR